MISGISKIRSISRRDFLNLLISCLLIHYDISLSRSNILTSALRSVEALLQMSRGLHDKPMNSSLYSSQTPGIQTPRLNQVVTYLTVLFNNGTRSMPAILRIQVQTHHHLFIWLGGVDWTIINFMKISLMLRGSQWYECGKKLKWAQLCRVFDVQ